MKQVIVDYIPFNITPTQINESMKENNGKLIVKGVLQRAEAKNQNGIKLGISSRGLGSVEMVRESNGDTVSKVGDDFELIAFDFVSNPSTHGAFLYPETVNESVDNLQQGRTCGEYCRAEDIINHIIRGE